MSLFKFKIKGQLGLHSKFQASQGYTVRPCLKTNKPKQQKSHRKLLNPEMRWCYSDEKSTIPMFEGTNSVMLNE